jgi:hypothetical protein
MIEDEQGNAYLLAVGTGQLTQVDAEAAAALLRDREYRVWRGDRSWALIDRLPVALGATPTLPPQAIAVTETEQPGG